MTEPNQSFSDYVMECVEHLMEGLTTEREFATRIARAAAGEQPGTDAATDLEFDEAVSGGAKQ